MKPATVEHTPGLPNLPPGWHFSRNYHGSITVWAPDGGAVVVGAVAYEDRRMPEEMLYALAHAMLSARADSLNSGARTAAA